jgi:hypothetical protein
VGGNFYGEKSFVELWDVKEVKELWINIFDDFMINSKFKKKMIKFFETKEKL